MFGPRIQHYARHIAEMVVRPLARIGLTPNMATLIGLLLNAIVAAVLASGHLRIGGALLVIAGLFDMIDGALARVRNQKTVFGAFFDSTLDRYSEGIVLLGVILFALYQPLPRTMAWERPWVIVLAYVAGLGSLMVSYARARAEGLGLEMKSGLMARPERIVLLAAGLILGAAYWLVWTLLLLAASSVFTSVQRIIVVYRRITRMQHAAPLASPPHDAAPGMPVQRDGGDTSNNGHLDGRNGHRGARRPDAAQAQQEPASPEHSTKR